MLGLGEHRVGQIDADEPADDGRTDTMMWIEVDLAGIMRAIPARMLKDRIQRVSDIEMVAIKAAVESGARESAES